MFLFHLRIRTQWIDFEVKVKLEKPLKPELHQSGFVVYCCTTNHNKNKLWIVL